MASPAHEKRFFDAYNAGAEGADLRELDLSGTIAISPKLVRALLSQSNLSRADISGAYLRSADLSGANLSPVNLQSSDLRDANLRGAILKSANLQFCVLTGAKLSDANLQRCRLTKAMLTGADLQNADLTGADLRGAKGTTVPQIQAARNWRDAISDKPIADSLGLAVDADLSRYGSKPRRTKTTAIIVDVRVQDTRPVFGDVFALTGDEHPNFPPSGKFNLAKIQILGLEQVGDYFAILRRGSESVELWPLIGRHAVMHHPGPFDGVRLLVKQPTAAKVEELIKLATSLESTFHGRIEYVEEEGRPGVSISLEELEKRLTAK